MQIDEYVELGTKHYGRTQGVLVDQYSRYYPKAAELLNEGTERMAREVARAEPYSRWRIEQAVPVVAEPLGLVSVVVDAGIWIVDWDYPGWEVDQLCRIVGRRRQTQRPSSLAVRRAIRVTSLGSLPAASHSSGDMANSG